MALNGGVRVEGLSKLIRDLDLSAKEIDDLKDAFQALSKEGAAAASAFAPKDSGALAASIRGNRAKNKAVVTAGKGSVVYGGAINYGWSAHNIAPSGFMQKADEQLRPRAVTVLDEEINKLLSARGLS